MGASMGSVVEGVDNGLVLAFPPGIAAVEDEADDSQDGQEAKPYHEGSEDLWRLVIISDHHYCGHCYRKEGRFDAIIHGFLRGCVGKWRDQQYDGVALL